jgi:hypothetical protein
VYGCGPTIRASSASYPETVTGIVTGAPRAGDSLAKRTTADFQIPESVSGIVVVPEIVVLPVAVDSALLYWSSISTEYVIGPLVAGTSATQVIRVPLTAHADDVAESAI